MKKSIFAFLFGAAAGSVATWFVMKDYYEKRERESIESVKEVFGKAFKPKPDEDAADPGVPKTSVSEKEPVDITEYAKILSKEQYVNYSNSAMPEDPEKTEEVEQTKPYIVAPEQFQEDEDYTVISLTYFKDGVLTDDNLAIMSDEDVESSIGSREVLTHFGEYEDDSVYVRNERLKVEYEILRDQRTYAEVVKSKPYLMEDYDAT